ncbi:MAG: HDOD domain-containing protein [Opitutales bacterium]
MPPKFEVLARLCTLLRSPYAEISQIVELVAIDPGLASSVVKMANSSFYGCREPIDLIDNAVERIGFTEVMKMVGVLGRRSFPPTPLLCYGMSANDAWCEALGAAVLMEYLAYHADMEPGTAYLVGLMHGIGRYPIARKMAKVKPSCQAPEHFHLLEQSRWERQMLDVDYAATGAALLKMWNFGPEVYEPIAQHVQPFLRQGERKMACLLNIGLSVLPYLTAQNDDEAFPSIPETALSSVGLNEEALRCCIAPSRAWLNSTNCLLEEHLRSA